MIKKELVFINSDEYVAYHWDSIACGARGEFILKGPLQMPAEKITTDEEMIEAICCDLKKRGNSKPRTLKTLASTVKAILKNALNDQQIENLLKKMQNKKIIAVSNGTKVTYDLESV
jgi:hypothetical protein